MYHLNLSPNELASQIGDVFISNGIRMSDELETEIANVIERNLTKRSADLTEYACKICGLVGEFHDDAATSPAPPSLGSGTRNVSRQ